MKPTKKLFLAMTIAMVAVAMIDNTRGVFVPSFKRSFSMDDVGIGYILFTSSLSYVTGSFFAGKFIEKFYQKKTMIISAIVEIMGLAMIVFMNDIYSFVLGIIMTNFAIACISMSINTTVPQLNVARRALMMNFVHFLYGVGATITQKMSGILLFNGLDFRDIYFIIMLFYTILLVLSFVSGFANSDIGANVPILNQEKAQKKDGLENKKTVKFNNEEKKLIVMISVALGLYATAELQTGNWFYSYIIENFELNSSAATNYTATFFALFTFGRLVGGLVAEKIGYMKSVILTMCIAAIMYIVGLNIGFAGLAIISASGLFFSIVYPTVLVVLKDIFYDKFVVASGIVIAAASAVNMIANPLLGTTSKYFGVRTAMLFLPISLILSTVIMMYVDRISSNEE